MTEHTQEEIVAYLQQAVGIAVELVDAGEPVPEHLLLAVREYTAMQQQIKESLDGPKIIVETALRPKRKKIKMAKTTKKAKTVEPVKKAKGGFIDHKDHMKKHSSGFKPHHEHVKSMCGGGKVKK